MWFGRADYEFLETQSGEIPLRLGDIVKVERSVNDSWLSGINLSSSQSGMFPTEFITPINLPSNLDPGQRVLFSSRPFEAQQPGDLSFYAGTLILCLRTVDANWSEGYLIDPSTGRSTGAKGVFPESFATPLEVDAKNELEANGHSSESTDSLDFDESWPVAKVIHDLDPKLPEEIELRKGDFVYVMQKTDEFFCKVRTKGNRNKVGVCPMSFLKIEESRAQSTPQHSISLPEDLVPYGSVKYSFKSEFPSELSLKEGDIVKLIRHVDCEWTEGELYGKVGLFPSSYIDIIVDCGTEPTTSSSDSGYLSEEPTEKHKDERTVIFDFIASNQGDLDARQGDKVVVLKSLNADWLEAEHVTNGRRGIIPANHLSSKDRPKSMDDVCWRQNSRSLDQSIAQNVAALNLNLPPKSPNHSRSSSSAGSEMDFSIFTKQEPVQKSVPPPRPSTAPRFSFEFLQNRRAQKEEEKKEKQRTEHQRVAQELIKSEKSFLNDLETCVRVLTTFDGPRFDAKTLTLGMNEAAELSRKVIVGLDAEIEREFTKQQIGRVFTKLQNEFRNVYDRFWERGEESLVLLEKYQSESSSKDLLTQCLARMNQRGNSCIDMHSVLCRPVQRILKYPLFLAQMLKCTTEDHLDRSDLQEAVRLMAELAQSINESKRRKDLVVKYRKDGSQTFSDRISKINLHSVRKKSSRLGVRLSSSIGLTHLVRDESFELCEKQFRSLHRSVCQLERDVRTCCERLQHNVVQEQTLADLFHETWHTVYGQPPQHLAYALHKYRQAWRHVIDAILPDLFECVRLRVKTPLKSLTALFEGPDKLITKRKDKLLDFEAATGRVKAGNESNRNSMAEQERMAKMEYEALNSQLLTEMPVFCSMTEQVLLTCVRAYTAARARFCLQLKVTFDSLDGLLISSSTNRDGTLANFDTKHRKALEKLSTLLTDQQAPKPSSPGIYASFRSSQKQPKPKPKPTTVSFPQRRQSDADKASLRQKHAAQLLYVVSADVPASQNNQELYLNVDKGDLVVALVKKDPMGESSRWYVDNGVAKGFVARNLLTPLHVATRPRAPLPPTLTRQQTEPASLIDFSEPKPTDQSATSHVTDLAAIDWTPKPPVRLLKRSETLVPVRPAPAVPVRPPYQNVGYEETEKVRVEEPRKPVRTAPPPPVHLAQQYDTVDETEEDEEDTEFYVSQFDYLAGDTNNQLTLAEGQLLAVHSKSDQAGNLDWWLVEDEIGSFGYVPACYLKPHAIR